MVKVAVRRAGGILVCDGDSLTYGVGASAGMDYPSQLAALLPGWTKYAFGVGGQTIVQMAADAAAQIDPLYVTGKRNVLICWGGINDIYYGASAETAYTNVAAYCQARRAAGWTVTVCTMPAAGSVTGDGDTARQGANASIRAGYAAFADHLADLAANVHFATLADTTDGTYYNGDTVHLTDVGYGLVASIIKTGAGL